ATRLLGARTGPSRDLVRTSARDWFIAPCNVCRRLNLPEPLVRTSWHEPRLPRAAHRTVHDCPFGPVCGGTKGDEPSDATGRPHTCAGGCGVKAGSQPTGPRPVSALWRACMVMAAVAMTALAVPTAAVAAPTGPPAQLSAADLTLLNGVKQAGLW